MRSHYPVVTINVVIQKMSCIYTQTPSHKPNGKSIQNRDKHAHAQNNWEARRLDNNSSFYLTPFRYFISIGLVKHNK